MWPDAFWFHWLISLDVQLEFEKSLVVSVGYFQINHESDSLTIFSKGPRRLIISDPVIQYLFIEGVMHSGSSIRYPLFLSLGWLGFFLAEVWVIQRRRKMRKKMRKMRNDSLAKCDVEKKGMGHDKAFAKASLFSLFFSVWWCNHSSIRMKNPRAII